MLLTIPRQEHSIIGGGERYGCYYRYFKKRINRLTYNTGINNMIGYKLMDKGDMEQAGKHFALNVKSSSKVANIHDSYMIIF